MHTPSARYILRTAEADIGAVLRGVGVGAARAAEKGLHRVVAEPGAAAAHHLVYLTVRLVLIIGTGIGLKPVLHTLRDVARHVAHPVRRYVGGIGADRRARDIGIRVALFAAVGLAAVTGVAPRVFEALAAARRLYPLGLGGQ